jgi:cysteine synthase
MASPAVSHSFNPLPAPSRGEIYQSILDTVGMTPLVDLSRLCALKGVGGRVIAKLEYFNPLSSVKDRIGVAMIAYAEEQKIIEPGSVIIEATSGNTGIGLAFTCAVKKYRLILVMPETATEERKIMLRYLGAEIVLTPKEKGVRGAIDHAWELARTIPNGWMVDQDHNPGNIEAHKNTTAAEIWNDTAGEVDCFVGGVGTSGTLSGITQTLKAQNPAIKVFAVEPAASPVLSKGDDAANLHKIIGIGAFKPDFFSDDQVDGIVSIANEEAIEMARELAITEGIPAGISGGAAVAAALKVAAFPEMKNKNIVVLIASCAERYISTELFAHLKV